MPEIIDRFRVEHFDLNSITENRRHHVLVSLERLTTFSGRPIEETTADDLRGWMAEQMASGRKASTVHLRLTDAKCFFNWAWQAQLLSAEQLLRLRAVKAPRGAHDHVPRPYSRKELAQLWRSLEEKYPLTTERRLQRFTRGTARFRSDLRWHAMRLQLEAIIELALVCGLRQQEIYYLSIDDCHWDNKYIVVHGKRVNQHDKVREVPYPDSTRAAVQRWVRMRALLSPEPGAPLWLSVTGPNYAAGLHRHRMARILRTLGRWELHRLRHTCATERLRAGMELEKLQRFLGHGKLEQTLAYAQLVRGDIHKASERIDAEFQRAIKPPTPVKEAA